MLQIEFYAMGCHMQAMLAGEGKRAQAALSRVPQWFNEWEGRLSRFMPNSELNQMNLSAGTWFRLSDLMLENLKTAQRTVEYGQALFDPSMLLALETLGYDRSFDLMGAEQGGSVVARPIPAAGWDIVRLDEEAKRVRLPVGVGLDLGGIAKGQSARAAAERLGAFGPSLVDAGGDIAVSGPRDGGEAWPIAVASPLEPGVDLGWIWLKDGVVATSGRDLRRWQVEGEWRHHLLDPRTGLPADTDVMTATVVGEQSWQAEAGAKAALVLGSDDGLRWLEGKKEIEGILVLESGEVLATEGMGLHGWK